MIGALRQAVMHTWEEWDEIVDHHIFTTLRHLKAADFQTTDAWTRLLPLVALITFSF